ncbi:MAG: serine protease [Leptolyngbya sp. Prado105]|jgi:S1-C subfamily serine protease|nr:serine protease [Leptolyngbya sp. Prado105]
MLFLVRFLTLFLLTFVIVQSRAIDAAVASNSGEETTINVAALKTYSRQISVKVIAGDTSGSGVLIQRQGHLYSVITNAHVLQSASYQVQTVDGQIYSATRLAANVQDNDLAVLQFQAARSYIVATLAPDLEVQEGDLVIAVGFPFNRRHTDATGFKFTQGQISLLLNTPLQGGYQLGYTNAIEKGMSGGAVLNERGYLIGVNGVHARPILGGSRNYQDGSQPCLPIQRLVFRSSWALPADTIFSVFGSLLALQIAPPLFVDPADKQFDVSWHRLQMQQNAAIAKQCQDM